MVSTLMIIVKIVIKFYMIDIEMMKYIKSVDMPYKEWQSHSIFQILRIPLFFFGQP